MIQATLFVAAVCILAVNHVASADCLDMSVVPLATKSVKQSQGKVCGYSWLVIQESSGKDLKSYGINKKWFKKNFNGAHFTGVAFPVGHSADCPQHAPVNQLTSWSGTSSIYVRREFYISPESLASIKDMVVDYIIDDKILKVYVNGKSVSTGTRKSGSGCGYWAATNSFTVPASALDAGRNTIAIKAVNTGGPCYLDLGLSFTACSESAAIGDLHSCSPIVGPGVALRGCRARCDEEGYCRNKDPEDCGTSFHADVVGECLCEAAETLSCSGEVADVGAGVCYESEWQASQISRVAICPPTSETSCSA